jgi:hypothetical protein
MFSARLGFMRPDSVTDGVLWTPNDITSATILAWFDATDSADYVTEGGLVPALLDKSSNNVVMVNSQGSKQAIPGSTNGIPGLLFDGVDDFYSGQDVGPNLGDNKFRAADGYSFFTVVHVNRDSTEAQQMVHISTGSEIPGIDPKYNQNLLAQTMTPNHEYSQFIRTSRNDGSGYTRPGTQTVDWHLNYHGNNGTGGNNWYNVFNGDELRKQYTQTSHSDHTPYDRIAIGGMVRGWSAENGAYLFNNFANMTWNKTILFDKNLDLSDRQKLEGWAAHQLELTDNLPADHPYKSVAPEK